MSSAGTVERCVSLAVTHIENLLQEVHEGPAQAEEDWRWKMAETWLRTAEHIMRQGG